MRDRNVIIRPKLVDFRFWEIGPWIVGVKERSERKLERRINIPDGRNGSFNLNSEAKQPHSP